MHKEMRRGSGHGEAERRWGSGEEMGKGRAE